VARASREHLELLEEGRLHLSGIAKLVPHLTLENRVALLQRAEHRTKRQVEELIAELAPKRDVPGRIRKLPVPRTAAPPTEAGAASEAPALRPAPERAPSLEFGPDRAAGTAGAMPARRPVVEPLAPARYKVQFTASSELQQKLERLQALTPGADLAQVVEQAVTERLEARRFARVKKARKRVEEAEARPSSRYVPATIRRAVYERDGGRCTYSDASGRRCTARRHLEYHHHGRPFGRGGDHSTGNLRLCCRAHNALLAEQEYGREAMSRFRRQPDRVSESTAGYRCAAVVLDSVQTEWGGSGWRRHSPTARCDQGGRQSVKATRTQGPGRNANSALPGICPRVRSRSSRSTSRGPRPGPGHRSIRPRVGTRLTASNSRAVS
jgi:hypothetical protein